MIAPFLPILPQMYRQAPIFVYAISFLGGVAAYAEPQVSFEKEIRPILKQHCWHCHGEEPELAGGFDTRLAKYLVQGGESGNAVEPGDRESSLLYQRIAQQEMPPGEKKVPADQLERIGRWIDQGAKTDGPEPESLAVGDVILDSDRLHWSFQPIVRPSVPTVMNRDRVRTPVDAFLLAKLEASGLSLSEEAERATLVRRVWFDLLGLPPDRSAVEAAISARGDDWYEQTVDRLLASPAYGERWGRHWLDVVGYADSHGYTEKDVERKWAWRYRDYVVRSLNADKPWDEMIVEQLAGDELVGHPLTDLDDEKTEKLIATGFLRMIPDGTADGSADVKVASNDVMAETIKVVSSSLLGLTVGCAQCHSHRYDPISQNDYYAFRSLFEPAYNWKAWRTPDKRLVSLWSRATRDQANAVEKELKEVAAAREAALDQLVDETFEKELAKLPDEIQTDARQARQVDEKERSSAQKELVKKYPFLKVNRATVYLYLPDRLKGFNKKWDEATEAVKKKRPADDLVDCLTEPPLAEIKPPETCVFFRGDQNAPRHRVEPDELSVLKNEKRPFALSSDSTGTTTGRRLSYAKHLTDGKHPLVARVLVNRFWLHHFGRGLVSTVTDFGVLGEKPSHPELLDWLADEFMRREWNLKALHRLILTSTAYQQSSRRTAQGMEVDPDNRLWGRMPVRRLESEVVRDAVLAASDQLSFKRFGAPIPVTPDEVGQIIIGRDNRDSAGRPNGKRAEMGEEAVRRTIYVQVRRSMPLGILEPFDNPVMFPNCGQRACSTVAPQSLLMMNNEFVAENAQAFAARVEREIEGDLLPAQIEHAWYIAFGQPPTEAEAAQALAFVNSRESSDQRLVPFCHALLCSNPFLYVE